MLQGDVPAYRDLVPGIAGPDVRQLKEALRRLGFDPGTGDTYDAQTSAAVEAWYKAKGWEPFGSTREQLNAVRVLVREWGDALKAKAAAEAAAQSAGIAVTAARATASYNARVIAVDSAARVPEQPRAGDAQRSAATSLLESEARPRRACQHRGRC